MCLLEIWLVYMVYMASLKLRNKRKRCAPQVWILDYLSQSVLHLADCAAPSRLHRPYKALQEYAWCGCMMFDYLINYVTPINLRRDKRS